MHTVRNLLLRLVAIIIAAVLIIKNESLIHKKDLSPDGK